MRACAGLGALFIHGVGVARDRDRGLSLLAAACEARAGDACEMLARAREGPPRLELPAELTDPNPPAP
jgi:TPR repeat protein